MRAASEEVVARGRHQAVVACARQVGGEEKVVARVEREEGRAVARSSGKV